VAAIGTATNVEGVLLDNAQLLSGAGNVSIRGQGHSSAGDSRYGVSIVNGSVVESSTGLVAITGVGGNGSNLNVGVDINGTNSRVTSTGAGGNITIAGTGGNGTGNSNVGVAIRTGGATVNSTGTGTITITGTRGDGVTNNESVYIDGTVTSVTGNIQVTGNAGGTVTGAGNTGITLAGGLISSTGAATVTLTGTGGDGTNGNHGIRMISGGDVTSTGGAISLTGTGGGAGVTDNNAGVFMDGAGTTVAATNAATVTINGSGNNTAGNNMTGVRIGGGAAVSAVNGSTVITGTAGAAGLVNSFGVHVVSNGSVVSTGAGNIAITGTGAGGYNGVDLQLGTNTIGGASATGDILLRSLAGTGIGLGTGGGDAVNVTTTGNVTLNAVGGGTVTQASGAITAGGLRLLSDAETTFTLTSSTNNITNLAANVVGSISYTEGATALTINTAGLSTDSDGNGTLDGTTIGITTTGTGALTLTNGAALDMAADISTTGAVTQNGAGAVTITGARTISTTSDNVDFLRAVTLNGAGTTVAINTTAAGTGANITFQSTLDATTAGATAEDLTLTAGTAGSVTFTGAVGGIAALGDLTIVSANNVTETAGLAAATLTQSAGSGTTTLTGAVTTSGAGGVSLTGTNLALNNTLTTTGGGTVTVNESGTATIAAAGDITSDGAVSLTATGGISTAGDITTTNDDVTFVSATTLTGNVVIDSNGGNILFSSTLAGGSQDLTIAAGTGAGTTTFTGNVSNLGDGTGAALTVANGVTGLVRFQGTVGANSGLVASGGTSNFRFDQNVTLANGDTATNLAGAVQLDGLTFSGFDGITFGTTTLSTAAVTLDSNGGNLSLASLTGAQDLTLAAGVGAGTTTVTGNVSNLGDGTGAALTVASGVTGLVRFQGTVGANSGLVSNDSGGSTRFDQDVTLANGDTGSTFAGTVTFDGLNWSGFDGLTVTGAATMSGGPLSLDSNGGNILFSSTLAGGSQDLTIAAGTGAGTTTFTGNVSNLGDGTGAALTVAGLVASGGTSNFRFDQNVTLANGDTATNLAGAVQLDGLTFSGFDGITFGATTLSTAAVTLDSNGGNLAFTSTVDGAQDFTVTAGAGNITFSGVVGGGTRLGNVTINSAANVTATTFSATTLTQSAGTGTTTFNGAVDTNAAGGISLTGTNLAVNNTVTTTNAGPITVNESGTITIAAAGDITADGAVTLTATGGISTAGDITTTNDAVTFASGTTLTGNVAIDSGSANIGFDSTLNGGFALTANSTGTTTFTGAVGGSTALASLTTNAGGTTAINGGGVTTTGTQTYNDNVTLGASTALSATTATFNGTVAGSGNNLGVTGNAVFGDATTDTVTGLGTLSVSGNTTINTDTITSAGTQTYTGAVTLGADTTLTTTDSAVLFSSTVNSTGGARDLTVNAGTAGITFTGAVGGGAVLDAMTLNSTGTTTFSAAVSTGSLTTNAGGTTAINGGSITTSGTQTYNDDVAVGTSNATLTTTNSVVLFAGTTTLNRNLAVSSGSGTVTFTGAVDGANSLSVSASGTTTFTGAVGGGTALSALTTNGGGTTAVNGGSVTTTGAQTYTDAVTLNADTTLATTNSAVTFSSTIDSFDATARDLTVNTGSGLITLSGAIGGTNPLDVITLNSSAGAGIALPATTAQTLTVTGAGPLTDNGALIIPGVTTLAVGPGNNITLDNANNFGTVVITSGLDDPGRRQCDRPGRLHDLGRPDPDRRREHHPERGAHGGGRPDLCAHHAQHRHPPLDAGQQSWPDRPGARRHGDQHPRPRPAQCECRRPGSRYFPGHDEPEWPDQPAEPDADLRQRAHQPARSHRLGHDDHHRRRGHHRQRAFRGPRDFQLQCEWLRHHPRRSRQQLRHCFPEWWHDHPDQRQFGQSRRRDFDRCLHPVLARQPDHQFPDLERLDRQPGIDGRRPDHRCVHWHHFGEYHAHCRAERDGQRSRDGYHRWRFGHGHRRCECPAGGHHHRERCGYDQLARCHPVHLTHHQYRLAPHRRARLHRDRGRPVDRRQFLPLQRSGYAQRSPHPRRSVRPVQQHPQRWTGPHRQLDRQPDLCRRGRRHAAARFNYFRWCQRHDLLWRPGSDHRLPDL